MLHSRSVQDQKMDSFVRMLDFVINGKELYKPLITNVIIDAHLLSLGQKNYYTIDRDDYHIIVYLAEKDKSYFEQIDTEMLQKADYEHILQTLMSDRHLAFA